jgi:restriction endonuclease in pPIWI_RE module
MTVRDYGRWRDHRGLARALRDEWAPGPGHPKISEILDTELGLFVLESVAPAEAPSAVWTLLGGYPVAAAAGAAIGPREQQMITVARLLLPRYRSPRDWERLTAAYALAPEQVRGYLIAGDGSGFARREPRVAPHRFEVYQDALAEIPAYRKAGLRVAGPGDYLVRSSAGVETGVRIPAWLPVVPIAAGHDLDQGPSRSPFTVTWDQLRDTAEWADDTERRLGMPESRWAGRLKNITLAVPGPDGELRQCGELAVDGMFHLLGMVGSGKSTLMDLLCMHAARHHRKVTLVVGDVVTLLRKVDYFTRLGLAAAPIVGQSNRARHVERLHRLADGDDTRLTQLMSPLLDWVSTACPLDGLRDHSPRPWDVRRAPCNGLLPAGEEEPPPHACPVWGACERHAPARALAGADIWVATVPSLLYSQVPAQMNTERVRYLEVAWRRSDLILVDEADQAQAQVDTIFSPGQTLRGDNSEAWLDEIVEHTNAALRRQGWAPTSNPMVRVWTSAANNTKTAVDLMYLLLQIDRARKPQALLGWIDEDYFTDWTLSQQLAQSWAGFGGGKGRKPRPGWEQDELYVRLRSAFDAFIDDPFGAQGDEIAVSLARLATDVLREEDETRRLALVKDWLADLSGKDLAAGRGITVGDLDREAPRLEFTLAVAAVSDQLQVLLSTWRSVEDVIGLESANPLVFHRPPRDLLPLIPDAPMGHVLGFQYKRDEDGDDRALMGELRFFRCEGVGRWVVTHLPELFADESAPPANVLLTSGTSWAGTSPRYHVDVPVAGVLQPNADDVRAIAESHCELLLVYEDQGRRPIRVSGRYGEERERALQALVRGLARPRQDGKSLLERHRDKLEPGRQRVLLLTGSYEEARMAARTLARTRPGWDGQIRYLVRDDDEFADAWDGPAPLRRGDVAEFAGTGAWILIAPLLAVERGHNILNEDSVAALGAVYFLIRPHPRPDDLSYVAQRINQWASTQIRELLPAVTGEDRRTLADCGAALRSAGHQRWRKLLRQKLAYSTLSDNEREALIWSQLVTIWQVIGRLVRGGKPAAVYFCDAAFAPVTASPDEDGQDTAETSLVLGLRSVLEPYFRAGYHGTDRHLAEALYGPLYQALSRVGGM